MMRTIQIITLTLLASGCFSAQSQVQNNHFENWAFTDTTWDGQPIYVADQWSGGQRTNDSYSGNFAAKVEPYMSCGIARNYMVYGSTGPFFSFGDEQPDFNGSGAPIDFKPALLSGYFKFLSPAADDVAKGIVLLKKFNATTGISEEVGRGEVNFSPQTNYVSFNIPIIDLQPGMMPDSIVIAFSSGMGYGWENETSTFGTLLVDELRIQAGSFTAGIEESTFECSFYPNPAQGALHFSFATAMKDDFMLVITDMTGRKVANQPIVSGAESLVEIGSFRAGTYVATIEGKNKVYAEKMILKVD